MNARHLQFAALFVMQIDGCFHATECRGNVVHNLGNQLIEIENGRNLLRPFLPFEQMFDLIEWYGRDSGSVRNKRSWARGHGDPTSLEIRGKKEPYSQLDASV